MVAGAAWGRVPLSQLTPECDLGSGGQLCAASRVLLGVALVGLSASTHPGLSGRPCRPGPARTLRGLLRLEPSLGTGSAPTQPRECGIGHPQGAVNPQGLGPGCAASRRPAHSHLPQAELLRLQRDQGDPHAPTSQRQAPGPTAQVHTGDWGRSSKPTRGWSC